MAQLWNEFNEWYKNLHIDTIIDWIFTVAIPVIITFLIKRGNKSSIKEAKAVANDVTVTKHYEEQKTTIENHYQDLNYKVDKYIENQQKQNELVIGLLSLILKHAKIPQEAKEQAIKFVKNGKIVLNDNSFEKEVKLNDIIEETEEYIKEEKNRVEEPSILDDLVNSFKN